MTRRALSAVLFAACGLFGRAADAKVFPPGFDAPRIVSGDHPILEAGELNIPVLAADGVRADGSLFTVDDPTVVIDTVKLAEDRSGDLIVRLYESMNGLRRVTFKTAFAPAQIWRCNMVEETEEALEVKNGAATFDVKPFEIVTLRLKKA